MQIKRGKPRVLQEILCNVKWKIENDIMIGVGEKVGRQRQKCRQTRNQIKH